VIKILVWLYEHKLLKKLCLTNKLRVLLYKDLDPYYYMGGVLVTSKDIGTGIKTMEYIISVDFKSDYAIPLTTKFTQPRRIYGHAWLVYNGRLIDTALFNKWLSLSLHVVKLYSTGLKADKDSKMYRNSIKVQPVVMEIESVCCSMLN